MGENCSASSRLIVHKDIKDALLYKVTSLAYDPSTRTAFFTGRPQLPSFSG